MRSLGDVSFTSSQIKYHYLILLIVESGIFVAAAKTIEFVLFLLSPDNGLEGLNGFMSYIKLSLWLTSSYEAADVHQQDERRTSVEERRTQ